jgi:hypothetical protein
MNKYNIDFFYMHLFVLHYHIKKMVTAARKSILLSELMVTMLLFFKYNYFLKRKTAINVFFGSYRKGKYRTFNVIKLHTWFCLSYFLQTNIKCYCIYQYLMSINNFFNTVSVSRYNRNFNSIKCYVCLQEI